jgi:lipid-A-disaccharide synthase-like uncharacterized protein
MTFLTALGWMGQGAYFTRTLWQWAASERAGRGVAPAGYWRLSVLGALGLLSYAALGQDPVILVGQAVNLLVYLRNLTWLRGEVRPMSRAWILRLQVLAALLVLTLGAWSLHGNHSVWMLVGWAGQFLFLLRFPMQWSHLESRGVVEFSLGFWVASLAGSLLLTLYALSRHDWVIVSGQGLGILMYTRNLVLHLAPRPRALGDGSPR